MGAKAPIRRGLAASLTPGSRMTVGKMVKTKEKVDQRSSGPKINKFLAAGALSGYVSVQTSDYAALCKS